nr:FHA domain-containing protein [Zoogloeaceae bacterium]
MADRKNLCVIAAEIVGSPSLDAALGALEARHAVDRALRRVDLAVEANKGTSFGRDGTRVTATFERSELAVLAVCEMLERVSSLPPLAGKRLGIRAGVHYGQMEFGGETPVGEGLDVALRLMKAAEGGEALATGAAVILLPATTRHFSRLEAGGRPALQDLEWPLHTITRQTEVVVSLPPASRLTQRLKVRHQNEVVFLDDQRPILLLGRELGNDVVIMDPRASRQHCRIERRREGFSLIDYSSNGCYVVEESSAERRVRKSETAIVGPGRIGCGFSASEVERDLVFFEVV